MLGPLGMPELIIIGVIALLIFGPKQLPKLGRGLGQTLREFRHVGKELSSAADEVRDEAVEIRDDLRAAERKIRL
jgi:sec-independent protein translocase protein TatA